MAARSRGPDRRRSASAGRPSMKPAARAARRADMVEAFADSVSDRLAVQMNAAGQALDKGLGEYASRELFGLFVRNGPYRSAWSQSDRRARGYFLGLLGDPDRLRVYWPFRGQALFVGDAVHLMPDDACIAGDADLWRAFALDIEAAEDDAAASVPPWLRRMALPYAVARLRGRPVRRA